MAPTESSPAKLASLIWSTCLTNFLYQNPSVEGARYYHGNDDSRRAGRHLPPGHPASRFGRSHPASRFDDHREEEEEEESFYERNGLAPPPLVSRAHRLHRRTTELMTEEGTEAEGEEPQMKAETVGDNVDYSTRIRRDLIFSDDYDRHAYPWDYAWDGQAEGERTGVPVELSINFHRVFSVDVVNPVLDMIAWIRMGWTDPRLTWQPEEYGNLTKIWCWIGEGGAGGETSEIWTPDIELWNLEEGLRKSFDDAYAIVSHDGSVWWSRPGHLRPVCKFQGLISFPFDTLTCTMEFGSWAYSGKYMRLVKMGGTGFSIGGSETAGSSYNEFSLTKEDPVLCEVHVYPPFPASPEEDWPVLLYNVTMVRSWQPYARGYLLTQLLLNIIGFSAFWLPPSCGERMGLSITAMLAAVAAEIAVASNLPQASEYTWFQKVNLLSISFACISLLESVAVLYFYYKRSDKLIPGWFTEFKEWYLIRKARKQGGEAMSATGKAVRGTVRKFGSEVTNSFGKENDDGQHDHDAYNPTRDGDGKDSVHGEGRIKKVVTPDDKPSADSPGDEMRDKFEAYPLNPYRTGTEASTSILGSGEKQSAKQSAGEDEGSIDLSETDGYGTIGVEDSFNQSNISTLSFGDSCGKFNPSKALKKTKARTVTVNEDKACTDIVKKDEPTPFKTPDNKPSSDSLEEEMRDKFEVYPLNPYRMGTEASSSILGSGEEQSAKKSAGEDEGSIDLSEADDYGAIGVRDSFDHARISNLTYGDSSRRFSSSQASKGSRAQTVTFNEGKPNTVRGILRESKSVRFAARGERNDIPKSAGGERPRVGLSTARLDLDRRKLMENSRQGSLQSQIFARDADDFANEEEIEANMLWKRTAARIDDLARFWIPTAYFIAVGIVAGKVWPS